jgi:multiple sugar transport system substrate-binding protein
VAARPAALRSGANLVFLNDANQAGTVLVEQVLAAWQQAQPGVAVEWVRPEGTVSLTAMVAAGTPPDVFAADPNAFAGLAGGGETLALDGYAKRDRVDLADFFPAALELGRWQGKQHGLPRAFNAGVLYTNLSMFDQAGVPRPPEQWGGPRWTWNEFLDAAQRLSVRAEDPKQARFGADLLGGNGFFWSFVFANGGQMFDAEMTATRLHEPPAVAALQLLADLIHRQNANPTPDVKRALGDRNIFNNGQAAMQLIGASNVNLYQAIEQFPWDWRPLPAGRAGAKGWAVGFDWAVSSRSRLREEAWAFLQHLVSAASQATLAGNYFPARRTAVQRFLDDEAKAGRAPGGPPANWQVVLDAMQQAVVRANHARFADVQRVLDEELSPLWAQGGSAQAVAEAIKRRADPILQGT